MAATNRTRSTGSAVAVTMPDPAGASQPRSVASSPAWGVREVMDIRQAADYLGISADSLYKYASEGLIPAFKLGNRWRFKRSLLESWMERQSSTGSAPQREASPKPRQKKPASRAR